MPPPAIDALEITALSRIMDELDYYQILHLEPDARQSDVKRAYFVLSKEFHPDRYFRREIGGFQSRLVRVFKKIVEAYELVDDGHLDLEQFRAFTFENAVRFYACLDPDFFAGTIVETEAAAVLASPDA